MILAEKSRLLPNAQGIYPEAYRQLKHALTALADRNFLKAKVLLDKAAKRLPELENTPEGTQLLFFLEAAYKRLDPASSALGNLYLLPDQGQQIAMFNFMATRFPVVTFAQDIVNTLCLSEFQGQTHVTLLDIGIGTGQQIARILRQLTPATAPGQRLTVIGIEPAEANLAQARETLLEVARQQHLPVDFIGINQSVETLLTPQGWKAFTHQLGSVRHQGTLIVNASFALHHVQPIRLRLELFQKLRQLSPTRVTMIEPYADFVTPRLMQRFDEAWYHYGLTFQAIDRIDATDQEKSLVKQVFFAREIQDVLAKNGRRIEQFETGDMWLNRLTKAGFYPELPTGIPDTIPDCPSVSVKAFSNYIGLCVNEYPIISIIAVR